MLASPRRHLDTFSPRGTSQHSGGLRQLNKEGALAGHDVVARPHAHKDAVDGREAEGFRRHVGADLRQHNC